MSADEVHARNGRLRPGLWLSVVLPVAAGLWLALHTDADIGVPLEQSQSSAVVSSPTFTTPIPRMASARPSVTYQPPLPQWLPPPPEALPGSASLQPQPPSDAPGPLWRWMAGGIAALFGAVVARRRRPTAASSRPPLLAPLPWPAPAAPCPPAWATAAFLADSDDAEEDPFVYGEVRWLPPPDVTDSGAAPRAGELVMPVFPLGVVYLPGTNHTLNIFEPRYCELYSDVILNGSRRFVVPLIQMVPSPPPATPQRPRQATDMSIAEVGVVFYIEEFQKVDEATQGSIKYICEHKVIGRVRIKRLVNPRAVVDTSTYLRAVVEDFVDVDEDVDYLQTETKLSDMFRAVASLHEKLRDAEPVRFAYDMAPPGNQMTRGDSGTFWETATLWQALFRERLTFLHMRRTRAEQELVQKWLKDQGIDLADLLGKKEASKVGIRLTDLPQELQERYKRLQEDFEEASQPIMNHVYYAFQEMLQENRHGARLELMEKVMSEELQRLRAKAALKDLEERK
eukprot:EG_transcript_6088